MADTKNKQESTNSEFKKSDDFQKDMDVKVNIIELAKELLVSVTEKEFSKLGYEAVDKSAGEYGTGEKYGKGVEQNKYSVKVAGKSNASLEKQVFLGTQRVQSDIKFQYNGKMVNIQYETIENGAFRGVDSQKIPYAFTETVSVDGSNKKEIEKTMKELFEKGAKKEIGYLTNTRLGVDDKLDQSTASTVNENDMKKLTIKNIFFGDDDVFNVNESLSDKLKEKNTIPVKNVKPYDKTKTAPKDKYLMFDEKGLEELSVSNKDRFEKELAKMGAKKLSDLTPVEKKELFNVLKQSKVSKEEPAEIQNEITTAGPAGAGAGAFLTPNAFKATPYNQYKGKSKPQVTKEYNVVPNSEGYNGQFWTKVNVDVLKDAHPQGMPGIKPNSKEEWAATTKGDTNKLKRLGLKESITPIVKAKLDLTKKKMFSTSENESKGINKRYLVTEKTSDEYLKERWNKLTNFKLYESISETLETEDIISENVSIDIPEIIEEIKNELPKISTKTIKTSNLEETVSVQKPGSIFGIEYVFYKKDFLNEDKKYILDLASRVFVPNPNTNKNILVKPNPNAQR